MFGLADFKEFISTKIFWRIDHSRDGIACVADIPQRPFLYHTPEFEDKRISESYSTANVQWYHHETVFIIKKKVVVEPRNLLVISGLNKIVGASMIFPDLRPSIKDYVQYRLGFNKKAKKKFPKAVVFAGPGGLNYFHFFADIVNKLWLFEKYNIDPSTPILITKAVYEKMYFKYIYNNYISSRYNFLVVEPGNFIEVENLTLLNPMAFDKLLWQKTIGLFNNIRTAPAPTKRIFLSRSKKSGRFVSNFDEILPVLQKWGFVVIDTDILHFEDQVKIFSQTQYLVAVHGAGETNIMFSQPQYLHFLELNPGNRIVSYFYWLSEMLQVKYYNCLLGGDINGVNIKPEPGFEIDAVQLDKAIEKMFSIK